MTPTQALEMIDGALSTMPLNRGDHAKLSAAVELLRRQSDSYAQLVSDNAALTTQLAAVAAASAP